MSIMYAKEFGDTNTIIAKDWEHASAFIKAILDINSEERSLGEYAILITEEEGIRIDYTWVANEDDQVVFTTGQGLLEYMTHQEEDDDES